MSLTYIVAAFIGVLLNNAFVEKFSLSLRVTIGYVLSFVMLLLIAVLDVRMAVFDAANSYRVTLVAVATVALGCTGLFRHYLASNKKTFSFMFGLMYCRSGLKFKLKLESVTTYLKHILSRTDLGYFGLKQNQNCSKRACEKGRMLYNWGIYTWKKSFKIALSIQGLATFFNHFTNSI